MNELTDEEILALIKAGDPKGIEAAYLKCREPCVRALKYKIFYSNEPNADDLALGFFHEAMLILVARLESDKPFDLYVKLRTYLNGICRFLYLKHKNRRGTDEIDLEKLPLKLAVSMVEMDSDDDRKRMYACIKKLGERCREIIFRFYLLGESMQTITEIMGYKGTDVTKAKKYKCMISLRKCCRKSL